MEWFIAMCMMGGLVFCASGPALVVTKANLTGTALGLAWAALVTGLVGALLILWMALEMARGRPWPAGAWRLGAFVLVLMTAVFLAASRYA